MRRAIATALLAALPCSCTQYLFSGIPKIDKSRPAVLVETRGGVEHGVATYHGVLFLGRTAQEGPCRIRYMIGGSMNVEDGWIVPHSGPFFEVRTDVKTPSIHILERPLEKKDKLYAMVFPERGKPYRVRVRPADEDGITGDVLRKPYRGLPVGAPLLVRDRKFGLRLAGMVRGTASWQADANSKTKEFVVFAGPERLREALAVPRQIEGELTPIYRPDDIEYLRDWREPHFTTELPQPQDDGDAPATPPLAPESEDGSGN